MLGEPNVVRPRFALHARLRSFTFAFAGLRYLFASEHNMWLHGLAAVIAASSGVALGLKPAEWLWIVLAIGLVITAEAFNTAVERLADAITQERDPRIGAAKDVAAAGVLVASIMAAAIGGLVFVPRLTAMIS